MKCLRVIDEDFKKRPDGTNLPIVISCGKPMKYTGQVRIEGARVVTTYRCPEGHEYSVRRAVSVRGSSAPSR